MFTALALGIVRYVLGLAEAEFNFATIDVLGPARTVVKENSKAAIKGEHDVWLAQRMASLDKRTASEHSMYLARQLHSIRLMIKAKL